MGITSLAIANDSTAGIRLNWILMVGSDYTGTANSSWGAYSGGKFGNGHTAAWGTNTSHDFWISGVQWELGSVATPFEHRSFADELRMCQRYYYKSYDYGTAAGTATSAGSLNNGGLTGVNNASHATSASGFISLLNGFTIT